MDETKHTLAEALRRPRYEVIPLQGVEEAVVEHVPKDVKLTVTADKPADFSLNLRIPRWCQNATLKVNGEAASPMPEKWATGWTC